MSKYIKLEDAIEQVKTEFYGGGYQEWLEISIDNLINRIAYLPTIDIVNCIECSYLGDDWWCYKHEFTPIPIENYFCKDGEWREE